MISVRNLVPYAGAEERGQMGPPPLDAVLDRRGRASALRLFRTGLDSVAIGWRLECTPAAAANGIARARDEERRAAA